VRIHADPDRLAARGIGLDELMKAVGAANVNQPIGNLDGSRQSFAMRDQRPARETAAAYRPLIVAWRNGAPVRLGEVAEGPSTAWRTTSAPTGWWTWIQARAIILAIQRQPGANTIATVDAIKAVLPAFQEKLPASVELKVFYDRSVIHPRVDSTTCSSPWCWRASW
jgi:HAE1 family hydrophobic/amphiphilic exporter-1